MNQFDQNIRTQSCPVCGAAPGERIWSEIAHSGYFRLISEKHKAIGSVVTPLVCTQCGYVQLFVRPEEFRR